MLSELASRCHRERRVGENPAKDLAAGSRTVCPSSTAAMGSVPPRPIASSAISTSTARPLRSGTRSPSSNHNEIVGWNQLAELTEENFVLVLLREPGEHERVKLRFEITRNLIERPRRGGHRGPRRGRRRRSLACCP